MQKHVSCLIAKKIRWLLNQDCWGEHEGLSNAFEYSLVVLA